jgi:hypothetical protein
MKLCLFELPDHPNRFAVTETEAMIADGTFFLDFTRPLKVRRWLGVANYSFGIAVGMLVPIIHECEREGGYVIAVNRSDPYFENIWSLWKKRYPSKPVPPRPLDDQLKIVGDFYIQFPKSSGSGTPTKDAPA